MSELMDIAGYSASVFIGLALGLISGGGSILTVPLLVYLSRTDAVPATACPLSTVGLTAFARSAFLKTRLNVQHDRISEQHCLVTNSIKTEIKLNPKIRNSVTKVTEQETEIQEL